MSDKTPSQNSRLVLAERPERGPVTATTFKREQVDLGGLKEGDVLVKVEYSAIVRYFCSHCSFKGVFSNLV